MGLCYVSRSLYRMPPRAFLPSMEPNPGQAGGSGGLGVATGLPDSEDDYGADGEGHAPGDGWDKDWEEEEEEDEEEREKERERERERERQSERRRQKGKERVGDWEAGVRNTAKGKSSAKMD